MLTVTEFAKKMGVTRQTVLNWIYKGVIKASQPLKEYRIEESEIDRLKAGGSTNELRQHTR